MKYAVDHDIVQAIKSNTSFQMLRREVYEFYRPNVIGLLKNYTQQMQN